MASRKEEKAKARAERERREAEAAAGERRRQRLLILGGALAVAAVIVVAAILIASSGDDDGGGGGSKADTINTTFAGIPQSRVVLGNANAPVTMVEFADLQCPFCAQYSKEVLPTLVDKYVKTGRVKMELRLIGILGPDSKTASQWAAAAALQDKTWQYAESFYENQGQEGSGYVNEDFLRSVGDQVDGLNVDEVAEQQSSAPAKAIVTKSDREAATANVQGTPSFSIGRSGGTLTPLQLTQLDAASFEGPIDAELAKAGG